MVFARERLIRFSHCDPAGIVYFPRYFEYFDQCTAGIFEAIGYRKPALLQTYDFAGFPVVDVHANFRVPSKFGDDVVVHTRIPEWGRSSFKVHHRLMKGDALGVEGFETRVWVARDPARPGGIKAQPLPAELFERFRNG